MYITHRCPQSVAAYHRRLVPLAGERRRPIRSLVRFLIVLWKMFEKVFRTYCSRTREVRYVSVQYVLHSLHHFNTLAGGTARHRNGRETKCLFACFSLFFFFNKHVGLNDLSKSGRNDRICKKKKRGGGKFLQTTSNRSSRFVMANKCTGQIKKEVNK